MRPDLAQRLAKVATVLKLLKKLALTEGEFIDRASKRSLEIMKRALGKVETALDRLVSDPAAKDKALRALEQVITPTGVVNQEMMAQKSSKPYEIIRMFNKLSTPLAGVVARLVSGAVFAARMQNSDLTEMAKADPRYREQFQRAQEKLADNLGRLDKMLSEISFPEQPQSPEQSQDPQDSTAVEGVENQLRDLEKDMRDDVQKLTEVMEQQAGALFPDDHDLQDAIAQNLTAAMAGKRVNRKLNTDKGFYQDVLHMEKGSQYDLGEFLSTKNKKLMYQAYRSTVMAIRALGVVQWAKERPAVVAKSKKALNLVVKAKQILRKRSGLVISKLKTLQREMDEEEEERGIPKGTFSDTFDNAA